MLRIHLLGHLRVYLDDQPLRIAALPKTVPLWAYLLLHSQEPLARSHLAALLWPDQPEGEGRTNLRRHLHELRRVLPPAPEGTPWLLVESATLRWNPAAPYWLDVADFDRRTQATPPNPADLDAALRLYTGDLLADLYDDWIFYIRERLRGQLLTSLAWLMQHAQAGQDYPRAIDYGQQILRYDPMREDVVRSLMALRQEDGDRAGVLQEYRRFEQRLRAEMDLAPMVETQALYDTLARQNAAPAATFQLPPAPAEPLAVIPDLPTPKLPPTNLPAQLTSFVGREQEMAALTALLASSTSAARLVTLTGTGGSGKTRLALEVAARLHRDEPPVFPAGVFWVPLATVRDPDRVLPEIGEALGVRDLGDQALLDTLKQTLRGRRLLLVLDNFEHLVQASLHLLDLLRSAPGLRLLVTSRAPLHLYGEQEFPVMPLPLPADAGLATPQELARVASVTLFLARSRAVNPSFALTPANAPAIAEICRRVDGLPLAIELAAARCRLLDPASLLARLDDRLGFLQDRSRPIDARHHTLRATLEWSYTLLGASERRLFAALAVFAGSFDLAAAAAIWGAEGDVLDGLEALVDHSLLQQYVPEDGGTTPDEPRFRMLSTIREYAGTLWHTLPEAETVACHHAAYYLEMARDSRTRLRTGDQVHWLLRLEWEHDNLRAALRWTLEGDVARATLGVELAGALGQFWYMAGHYTEGQRWLHAVLDKAGESAAALAQAQAHYALGSLLHAQGDLRHAQPAFEQSLALYRAAGDRHGTADALYALGRLANRRQEYAAAAALLEESLVLAQQLEYTYRIGYLLNSLATLRLGFDDLPAAHALYVEALASARHIDNKTGIAFFLTSLGELARQQGDYARAEGHYREAMTLAEALHQKSRMVMLLHNLAYVVLRRGNARRAAALFRESLTLGNELPDKENFGMCLVGLGAVAVVEGDLSRAATFFGAGEAMLASIGARLDPADQIEYDHYAADARARLDPATYGVQFDLGRNFTPEQAEQVALGAQ